MKSLVILQANMPHALGGIFSSEKVLIALCIVTSIIVVASFMQIVKVVDSDHETMQKNLHKGAEK